MVTMLKTQYILILSNCMSNERLAECSKVANTITIIEFTTILAFYED